MRQYVGLLLALFLVVDLQGMGQAAQGIEIPAKAYLLMDVTTGEVLLQHEGRTELPMASTTKIMTAILALEKGTLSDVVIAGEKPYNTGGTTIYLEIGEHQTLENLLYALMLESANDAAVAIAEHMAGSEEAFAKWMNEKARQIGAEHTHFVNSHGLHEPGHYTTAYDLALIARYAMQNEQFRSLVTTEERLIPGAKQNQNPPRTLQSHNRLLGYYEGITGVKNGYTEEAGLTNVASAKRGDTELLAVVLGAEDRLWTSSMAILDFGFAHYRTHVVARKGDSLGQLVLSGGETTSVAAGDNLAVTLPVETPLPEVVLDLAPDMKAPLAAGAPVGQVRAVSEGKLLAATDAVVSAPVADTAVAGPSASSRAPAYKQAALVMAVLGTSALAAYQAGRRRRRGGPRLGRAHVRGRMSETRNRRL